ncbi:MAG: PAS domain S-box protein [Thermodesulfobacteriota bacterium]
MTGKLSYQQLEQRVKELEKESLDHKKARDPLPFLTHLFESSIDGLAVVIGNAEKRIIYVNQVFAKMFGYSQEELMGQEIAFIYDKGQIDLLEEALGMTMERRWTGDLIGRKKDGTKFPVSMSSSQVQCDKGSIIVHIINHMEIIRENPTLEALRKSEAQKQAILDASIDRIRLVDKNMRIIWANKTTTRELQISPEDIIGKFCYQVLVDRDTPCSECPTKTALTSGNLEHAVLHQHASKCFKGETHWDNYSIPIKNKFGDIEGFIQITRNITDQVLAEQALRKSEEKYRSILENINEAYYEVDLAGNLTFFNDSLCKILGYKRAELQGMNNRQYTDKKNADKIYKDFRRVYKKGKTKKILDHAIIRKNGSRRNIEGSVSLMKDLQGNAIGFRGLFRDVTERKRAEQALKKREAELAKVNKQLIETNKALSVLAKNLDITKKESEKWVIQRIRSCIIPIIEKLQLDKHVERYRIDLDLLTRCISDLSSDVANDIKIALALSNSELHVASLIRNGMSNQEIARHLYITLATVKTHRRNIRRKLELHNSGINLKAYLKSELD